MSLDCSLGPCLPPRDVHRHGRSVDHEYELRMKAREDMQREYDRTVRPYRILSAIAFGIVIGLLLSHITNG